MSQTGPEAEGVMALFYGQNIKCKYITVMLYISMSCCIHQCYVEVNGISKAFTSVLYAVNRVLNVTNRCCLLYIFLAMWHQDQTS